jgi:hypothetical protein
MNVFAISICFFVVDEVLFVMLTLSGTVAPGSAFCIDRLFSVSRVCSDATNLAFSPFSPALLSGTSVVPCCNVASLQVFNATSCASFQGRMCFANCDPLSRPWSELQFSLLVSPFQTTFFGWAMLALFVASILMLLLIFLLRLDLKVKKRGVFRFVKSAAIVSLSLLVCAVSLCFLFFFRDDSVLFWFLGCLFSSILRASVALLVLWRRELVTSPVVAAVSGALLFTGQMLLLVLSSVTPLFVLCATMLLLVDVVVIALWAAPKSVLLAMCACGIAALLYLVVLNVVLIGGSGADVTYRTFVAIVAQQTTTLILLGYSFFRSLVRERKQTKSEVPIKATGSL